ncbi:MAG TPA: hypothetical protein VMU33_08150 [Burkholderiaceae bacterium]|nr:hypothetical protein [Burkholderiaceae bacterium]
MQRDLKIKTCSLAGTSDLTVIAPLRRGLVPSQDSVTYKTRAKQVLRTLHLGRSSLHEFELARILSDAVERVGQIHSVRIAVLEPEDHVLLAVTFDGSWQAYVRVIWQKVSRLLDLIFCNTENYVLGWDSSYEEWAAWLRKAQAETSFLYAVPGMTAADTQYLRMEERLERRQSNVDIGVTRMSIPSAEAIAARMVEDGVDLTNIQVTAKQTNISFNEQLNPKEAAVPAVRQGLKALVGLYALADFYPPGTFDGTLLLRAAHELLPEFWRMVNTGTDQAAIVREFDRFKEPVKWFFANGVMETPPKRRPLNEQVSLPKFDRNDVQGGIVRKYSRADYGVLLLVSFTSAAALAKFMERCAPTRDSDDLKPGAIAVNVGFTVQGLRAAGLSDEEIRKLPEEFVQGMERRSSILGDYRSNHPHRWRLPTCNWQDGPQAKDLSEDAATARIDMSSVHAVLQLRYLVLPGSEMDEAGARTKLHAYLTDVVRIDPGIVPLSLQWMRCYRNADGKVVEHFGFRDGLSQPVFDDSEKRAGQVYDPRASLGEVLLGYDNAADPAPDSAPEMDETRNFLRNGTFLVIRKLRQDIAGLKNAVEKMKEAAAVPGLDDDLILAKMMGRWPDQSDDPTKKSTLGGNPLVAAHGLNDFRYKFDSDGSKCPFHAHIRRANPRTQIPAELDAPGGRPPRLVRRGMSYGPKHDPKLQGDAAQASLQQERGLVFMAYNASIGEQFEVVQRWLAGGNSSGSYSGQSDPFLGVAEAGRQRYFRFEQEGKTLRMPLDGSDRNGADPDPIVRLEWGLYAFMPSLATWNWLKARAGAVGNAVAAVWTGDEGERAIGRLLEIESQPDDSNAIQAWKAALEDPDASANYLTASIWTAIREHHGGVLRTPYGILVASREGVDCVLRNADGNYTVTGYLERMRESFGEIYLGLDAKTNGEYERQSAACNAAIRKLDQEDTYRRARDATATALENFQRKAIQEASDYGESHWELTLGVDELVNEMLADICEAWFGLDNKGHSERQFFARGGFHWDWKPEDPPFYPGHFMAPSRYFFQPRPGTEVKRIGEEHGQALRKAMLAFLSQPAVSSRPPIVAEVLRSTGGAATDLAARTLIGAIMGFVPTVFGNLCAVMNDWLADGTFWRLRAQILAEQLRVGGLDAAKETIFPAFTRTMQLRTVPWLLWRKAEKSHMFGIDSAHRIEVKRGDVVVAALGSASQQNLLEGKTTLKPNFGDSDNAGPRPTHACPGYDAAIAMMLGFLAALLGSPWRLRAGPAPMTVGIDGPTNPIPAAGGQSAAAALPQPPAPPPAIPGPVASDAAPRILAIGDSWLRMWVGDSIDGKFQPSLSQSLMSGMSGMSGYWIDDSRCAWGRLLKDMADPDFLESVRADLNDPQAPKLTAILLGGGGDDVVAHSLTTDVTRCALFRMLKTGPCAEGDELDLDQVREFIDVELKGLLNDILKTLTSAAGAPQVPVFVHAYDYPIPDGRASATAGGPWLKPVFAARGYDFENNPSLLPQCRDVMRRLIDLLNEMVKQTVASAPYAGRVVHVDLRGVLEKQPDFENNKEAYWGDELHPTARGFQLLGDVMASAIRARVNN